VAGTFAADRLRPFVIGSLFTMGGGYRQRADGDLQYNGERPGEGWHAHGYFARRLWMLDLGRQQLVRKRIWKRRWLDPVVGQTCL
jgi:hypothetical protein